MALLSAPPPNSIACVPILTYPSREPKPICFDMHRQTPPSALTSSPLAHRQLGKKVNNTHLKFSLSLISACITLLINGDEDISPKVSAWVFPVMLVCGGLVTLVDWKRRPDVYAGAAQNKSKLSLAESPVGCISTFEILFF